ncbi:hypothetical protein ACHAXT_006878 [Thalassiosira profunda]
MNANIVVRDAGGGSSSSGRRTAVCTTAPRRMFLCDVPLFMKDGSASNFVRLMGTVVDIIEASDSSSCAGEGNATVSAEDNPAMQSTQSPANSGNATHHIPLTHFVIDDGTGSIGVIAHRRVEKNGSGDGRASAGNAASANTTAAERSTVMQNKQQYMQTANRSPKRTTLKSILSKPPPPISVGQTVDCIGRIEVANAKDIGGASSNDNSPPAQQLWLAASSVSISNNPQAMTLRQLELSTSRRTSSNNDGEYEGGRPAHGNGVPQNRILVGGALERRLNPLYHCHRQRSVVFDMENAFQYIKHSKDDGGITQKELASLAGALEANEVLAVTLAVQQLREDCRIYHIKTTRGNCFRCESAREC